MEKSQLFFAKKARKDDSDSNLEEVVKLNNSQPQSGRK